MIFCSGAVSQLDTFDYKPELIKRHGQPMPGGEKLITFQGEQGNLTKSPWEFRPYGQSGKMVSDLVPHLGELADEMCFIHSLTGKTNTHGPGENFMSHRLHARWLPQHGRVGDLRPRQRERHAAGVRRHPRSARRAAVGRAILGLRVSARRVSGTVSTPRKPIRNLRGPPAFSPATDRATRDFLAALNRHHLERFPGDTELAARIASYELAARMQLSRARSRRHFQRAGAHSEDVRRRRRRAIR